MVQRPASSPTLLWPPDDTEESIVGVDRHQSDIVTLRIGINEEAHRQAGAGPLPWQAISQIMLLGCRRPDGSPYTTYPDVMVYPHLMDVERGSYSLQQDGPPVLILEVASATTYQVDLDAEQGKAWSYAQAGVRECLVLDPTAAFIPEHGRGWRLVGGTVQPWRPDQAGRWRSETIRVALGVEGGLAAVYGADGRRKLREGEIDAAVAASRATGHVEGRAEGEAIGRSAGLRQGIAVLLQVRFGEAAQPLLDALAGINDPVALEALLARTPALTTLAEAQAALDAMPI